MSISINGSESCKYAPELSDTCSRSNGVAIRFQRTNFSPSDHVRTILNQLKFGWSIPIWPSFRRNSYVTFLGRRYSTKSDDTLCSTSASVDGDLSTFADDFASRIWFTYRENFSPICPNFFEVGSNGNPMSGDCSAARNFACQTQLADTSQSKSLPETSQLVTDFESGPLFNVSPLAGELSTHTFIHRNFEKRERSPRKLSHFTDILETAAPNGIGESTGTSKLRHTHHIPLSIQTSDCGWGCMIRSGQMLLAQALTTHILGRNWRLFRRKKLIATAEDCVHRDLIRWFHDCWSPAAPFSLHRLVRLSGQQPGTWFGPGSMCAALVKAVASAMDQFEVLSQIHVYYARDRVIYRQEIMELARGDPVTRKLNRFHFTDHTGNYASRSLCNVNQPDILPDALTTTGKLKDLSSSVVQYSTQNAVIILIPLMLGTSKHIDRSFIPMICGLFADPCCIGLIGGRPKHSVYVAGSVARELVYLDPHYTQPVVSDISRVDFCVKSWHCSVPKTMDAAKLDPSCAVGFYCRSRCELSDLLERLPQLLQTGSVCAKSLIEIVDEEVNEAV